MHSRRRETVLVTGGTGLVGQAVIRRMLREHPELHVVTLVRDAARWQSLAASLQCDSMAVTPVFGDVRCPGLGIEAGTRRYLAGVGAGVMHLAADTTFSQTLEHARRVNLCGTVHALDLAASLNRKAPFVHVSTAYVAGRRTGLISEDIDSGHDGWVNAYEQSKHEAERAVSESGLPWTIIRSSTVVCDGRAGGITQRNAVHRALELLYRGLAPMLPGDSLSPIDLVTTEHVAAGIATLRRHPEAVGRVFQLCAGARALALGELLDACFACWARDGEWRRRSITPPSLADLETYRMFEQTVEDVAAPSLKRITRALSFFAPQLAFPKRFDTSDSERLLGCAAPAVSELLPHVARAIAEGVA